MILTVDIGNTSISLGVFKNDKLYYNCKLASDKQKSADEYAAAIFEIFRMNGIESSDIEGAALLCVVPALQRTVINALSHFGIKPVVVGSGIKTGVNLRVDSPGLLGADIVAEAVGALCVKKAPLVVIDLGTATTLTVINEKNELCGCAIAPGVKLCADSLSSSCALLSDVFLQKPEKLLGTNSSDSINSGVVWGSAFMLDGFINRIRKEYNFEKDLSVIASGGLCELIVPLCESEIQSEPDLTLKGLYRIYKINKK